jgi:hypothetical protein
MNPGGHLFIINGDVRQLACDAWLLPTDQQFSITAAFCNAVGMPAPGTLPNAPSSWGEAGCLFLDDLNSDGQPDLWLGDIGRFNGSLHHYTQRAAEFIRRASERIRHRHLDLQRPPLLALNVIGSGEGGQRSRRGELLNALLPAIESAAREHHCDVALVTYGSVMYAAAQAARSRLGRTVDLWSDLPEALRSVGDQIAAEARSGNLVVFLGAGVSVAAGVPAWRQLLAQIGTDLGIEASQMTAIRDLDPRDQATVMQQLHPEGFSSAVQRSLAADRPSLLHGLVSSLPVKEFVTTNFDTLFERSAETAGRRLAVIPGGSVTAADRWLLKLHGTLGSDLVLTRGDYLGATLHHVALRGLVQAMVMTRHMLFIGYSLSDEDFHLLVHEVRSSGTANASGFGTALMPSPHPLMQHLWNDVAIVDTSSSEDHGDNPKETAARRLAILLDYVGSQSVSGIQFVADDSLGHLRTDEEATLANLVEQLHVLYGAHQAAGGSGNGWDEVRRFLDLFPQTEP